MTARTLETSKHCRIYHSSTNYILRNNDNKWSKTYDERPHRRGFSRGNVIWHRPLGNIARRLQQCRYRCWGLSDAFAALLFNGLFNAFQKLPLSVGVSRPHLIRGSFGSGAHTSQSSKRHLDLFSRFYRTHPCAQQTDRQTNRQITLRATSVSTGRIYAMHAMWPNTKKQR